MASRVTDVTGSFGMSSRARVRARDVDIEVIRHIRHTVDFVGLHVVLHVGQNSISVWPLPPCRKPSPRNPRA